MIKKEITELSEENKNKGKESSNLNTDLENKLTSKARELDRIKPPYDKRNLRNSLGLHGLLLINLKFESLVIISWIF